MGCVEVAELGEIFRGGLVNWPEVQEVCIKGFASFRLVLASGVVVQHVESGVPCEGRADAGDGDPGKLAAGEALSVGVEHLVIVEEDHAESSPQAVAIGLVIQGLENAR